MCANFYLLSNVAKLRSMGSIFTAQVIKNTIDNCIWPFSDKELVAFFHYFK